MSYEQYKPRGFNVLPPVVKNLLILNGLFFLATISLGDSFHVSLNGSTFQGLDDLLGLHYFGSHKFQPFQLITYMFMHGSFTHIIFNMFALWMFGNVLENYWGPKKFIIYFIVTGLGAALTHYLVMYLFDLRPVLDQMAAFLNNPSLQSFNSFMDSGSFKIVTNDLQEKFQVFAPQYNQLVQAHPDQALQLATDFMVYYRTELLNAPVVIGASGAIFGILLAFGMLFPNSLIYIYFAIPIKAKYFVILYAAMELYSGISKTGSNVAHFAHLGGMVFGVFLILFWKKQMKP
ncbi:MAG: rhomboid family intramembrane serine protease [Bacteroidota bacterium]